MLKANDRVVAGLANCALCSKRSTTGSVRLRAGL
jgi:hypothetical protein